MSLVLFCLTATDVGPSPSALVPNTVTFILVSIEGGQDDEDASKTYLHVPSTQEEAGMVAETQLLPEVESE